MFKIEAVTGPGSGVRLLNRPVPPPFQESVRFAEQNLYSRAKELIGDRNPRSLEYSVQLRAFDSSRNGSGLGMAVLMAFCGSALNRSLRGGLAIAGQLN